MNIYLSIYRYRGLSPPLAKPDGVVSPPLTPSLVCAWCVSLRLIFALVVLFLLTLIQLKLQHKLWLCLVLFLLLLPLAVLVIDHVYYLTFVGCFKVHAHADA